MKLLIYSSSSKVQFGPLKATNKRGFLRKSLPPPKENTRVDNPHSGAAKRSLEGFQKMLLS